MQLDQTSGGGSGTGPGTNVSKHVGMRLVGGEEARTQLEGHLTMLDIKEVCARALRCRRLEWWRRQLHWKLEEETTSPEVEDRQLAGPHLVRALKNWRRRRRLLRARQMLHWMAFVNECKRVQLKQFNVVSGKIDDYGRISTRVVASVVASVVGTLQGHCLSKPLRVPLDGLRCSPWWCRLE